MAGACNCCVLLLSVPVLALSGTLLGVGISRLSDPHAAAVARLDGGQCVNFWAALVCISSDVWTTAFGASSLFLLLLTLCGPRSVRWRLPLVALLLVLFLTVRLDDIAGEPAGGTLEHITATMNSSLAGYRDDPSTWDLVQQQLHCCGPTGPDSWTDLLGNDTVPRSCCDPVGPTPTNCSGSEGSFGAGCAVPVQALVADQRRWAVALATAAASLLLLLIVASTCCGGGRRRSFSEDERPLLDRSQADLDNYANQLNPNNWRYWSSRGIRRS